MAVHGPFASRRVPGFLLKQGSLGSVSPRRAAAFPVPHDFPGRHELLKCGRSRQYVTAHFTLLMGCAIGFLHVVGAQQGKAVFPFFQLVRGERLVELGGVGPIGHVERQFSMFAVCSPMGQHGWGGDLRE
jgi:hypothetical protein